MNTLPANTTPVRQLDHLRNWKIYLSTLTYVQNYFVEGSLIQDVGKPPNPASDIDMRIVVTDDSMSLLHEDWSELLKPLEPYRVSVNARGNRLVPLTGILGAERLADYHFVRVITDDGVVVDLDIYKESDAEALRSVIRPPKETWPIRKDYTPESVRRWTTDFAVVMAAIPCTFYSGELESTAFQLDLYRVDLVKVMYAAAGIDYARRYKHFSELFPQEWLDDLNSTYGEHSWEGLAGLVIFFWEWIGVYLSKLSLRVGGGFDASWYWPIYDIVEKQLLSFVSPE